MLGVCELGISTMKSNIMERLGVVHADYLKNHAVSDTGIKAVYIS